MKTKIVIASVGVAGLLLAAMAAMAIKVPPAMAVESQPVAALPATIVYRQCRVVANAAEKLHELRYVDNFSAADVRGMLGRSTASTQPDGNTIELMGRALNLTLAPEAAHKLSQTHGDDVFTLCLKGRGSLPDVGHGKASL